MEEAKIVATITSTTILFWFMISINVSAGLPDEKIVVITNNHTNYLSIRCFSFDNDGGDVKHLNAMGTFNITIKIRKFFPTSTMFNCSTNMGTFIAFKSSYQCVGHSEPCQWRFDENYTYRYDPKDKEWVLKEYNPNYESLARGGVIKGVKHYLQIYATTQFSQTGSICADTAAAPRTPQIKVSSGADRDQGDAGRGQGGAGRGGEGGTGGGQIGTGRGLGRKVVNARGTLSESARNISSSQPRGGHTVLPHLLLLLDTKGLQLV
ncbi:hypothetical protein BC332_20526 [Capsicum chinense]|nr:hypothetical protein BC332_20526 [Capsicum chinense]